MKLLRIIAAGLLYIACTTTMASALVVFDDKQSFLDRTFILTFDTGGKQTEFRFVVTREGNIYAFRNNSGDCANTGAVTSIGGANVTTYECGDYSETIRSSSELNGDTLSLTLDSPGELVRTISKFSFSSFGGVCRARSYSISIEYSPKLKDFKSKKLNHKPISCFVIRKTR